MNGRNPTEHELESLPYQLFFDVRPFAMEFLTSLAKDFEIIVFTAAEQMYADEVLNRLLEQIDGQSITDNTKQATISHRLYRQHTV